MPNFLLKSVCFSIPLLYYCMSWGVARAALRAFTGRKVLCCAADHFRCCVMSCMTNLEILPQAVGGNAALALLLTVGTNLVGIFTMPFMLCWLLGAGNSAVSLAPGPLLRSLMRTILAPLLVGAAARAFVPGNIWCTCLDTRVPLSVSRKQMPF